MKGYIKDYRQELKSDIWMMPPLYHRVWQYLKYQVNHEQKKIPMRDGTFLEIQKGQHLTSVRTIAEGVGWYERGKRKEPNPKTINDVLDWLIKQGMIQIERGKGNRQYTLITLVNWEVYQSNSDESNSKVTESKQSLDINKNDKNDKNEKKNKDYTSQIKNLLSSYPSDIQSLISVYWNEIKHTRKSGEISKSVIFKTMEKWEKYEQVVVKFALKEHLDRYGSDSDKDEKYTLGIMRRTTPEEAQDRLDRQQSQMKGDSRFGNQKSRPNLQSIEGTKSAAQVGRIRRKTV